MKLTPLLLSLTIVCLSVALATASPHRKLSQHLDAPVPAQSTSAPVPESTPVTTTTSGPDVSAAGGVGDIGSGILDQNKGVNGGEIVVAGSESVDVTTDLLKIVVVIKVKKVLDIKKEYADSTSINATATASSSPTDSMDSISDVNAMDVSATDSFKADLKALFLKVESEIVDKEKALVDLLTSHNVIHLRAGGIHFTPIFFQCHKIDIYSTTTSDGHICIPFIIGFEAEEEFSFEVFINASGNQDLIEAIVALGGFIKSITHDISNFRALGGEFRAKQKAIREAILEARLIGTTLAGFVGNREFCSNWEGERNDIEDSYTPASAASTSEESFGAEDFGYGQEFGSSGLGVDLVRIKCFLIENTVTFPPFVQNPFLQVLNEVLPLGVTSVDSSAVSAVSLPSRGIIVPVTVTCELVLRIDLKNGVSIGIGSGIGGGATGGHGPF